MHLCPQQVAQNTSHLGLLKGREPHRPDQSGRCSTAQLGDPQHTPKGCRSTTWRGISTPQGRGGRGQGEEKKATSVQKHRGTRNKDQETKHQKERQGTRTQKQQKQHQHQHQHQQQQQKQNHQTCYTRQLSTLHAAALEYQAKGTAKSIVIK